jgi:hypothetical protein
MVFEIKSRKKSTFYSFFNKKNKKDCFDNFLRSSIDESDKKIPPKSGICEGKIARVT